MISGFNGADYISGYGGIDHLFGGDGVDTIYGGNDNDLLAGNGGSDRLDGGAGYDWAYYQQATSGVTVDLRTGRATGGDGSDTLIAIENIEGSMHADGLIGNEGSKSSLAQNGADWMSGNGGIDQVRR